MKAEFHVIFLLRWIFFFFTQCVFEKNLILSVELSQHGRMYITLDTPPFGRRGGAMFAAYSHLQLKQRLVQWKRFFNSSMLEENLWKLNVKPLKWISIDKQKKWKNCCIFPSFSYARIYFRFKEQRMSLSWYFHRFGMLLMKIANLMLHG